MFNGTRKNFARSLRKYVPSAAKPLDAPFPVMSAENFRKLSNRDLSLYIHGPLASVESLRNISLSVLVDEINTRREFLTHKDIFRLVSGLANKNVIMNDHLLLSLSQAMQTHLTQFGAHELSNMIVELAACVRRLEGDVSKIFPLVANLCDEFGRKIFAATAVDLSNVMMGVADSGFEPSPALVEKIALATVIQIGTFRGPELCDLLSAFAIKGIKNHDLLTAAYEQISHRVHTLLTPQIVDLLFVLARFGYPPDLPFSVKELLETRICFELEKRHDHVDFKFFDFLISASTIGLLDRLPKSRSYIRSYLVDKKRHDWWFNVTSLTQLIQAIEASQICMIGRHIDYIPVGDFVNWSDALTMLKYLSNMLETEFIEEVDVAYGKALVRWLIGQQVRLGEDLKTVLQDLPSDIYTDVILPDEQCHGTSVVEDDPSRSNLPHVVELGAIIVEHIPEDSYVRGACKVSGISLDALVSRGEKRFGCLIVPDHDYHVYAKGFARKLKPRVVRQLEQLHACGIQGVTIDAKDWRNRDRVELVLNSFSTAS